MLRSLSPMPSVNLLSPDELIAFNAEVSKLIACHQRKIVNRKLADVYE